MSQGTYMLASFDSADRLLPAVETILTLSGIVRWHAVEGNHNLVVKLGSGTESTVEKLKKLDGLTDLKICPIRQDNEPTGALAETLPAVYLLMDVESSRKGSLVTELAELDMVRFCSETSGESDLVALATGESFAEIDGAVRNEIRLLDGVLRLRQYRIIDLHGM